jgi:hypothetical protein
MINNVIAKMKEYFNSFLNVFRKIGIMNYSKVCDDSTPDDQQHAPDKVDAARNASDDQQHAPDKVDAARNAPNISKKSIYTADFFIGLDKDL